MVRLWLVASVGVTVAAAPASPARAQDVSVAPACPTGNLLAGRMPAMRADASGNLGLLTDGSIANEGAVWDSFPAMKFDTAAGTVTYDLGAPTILRVAYIQADANDTYGVFGSMDGVSFRRIADLGTAEGHGLRARTVNLRGEVARFLRVGEGQGDNFYSMSEVQAFCQLPEPFPPALKVVTAPTVPKADQKLSGWNDVSSARFELILAGCGLALLGWGAWLARQGLAHHKRRLRDGLLALLGLVAAATYVNFGAFHFWNFIHNWDTAHYYIGSKYFRELEYDRLYECIAIADWEMGLKRRVELRKITNLRTNVLEHTGDIMAHPERCKSRFTDARWTAFKSDVAWFRGRVNTKNWEDMQTDHGFNGTPVWNIAGTILSNTGAASKTQIVLLDSIDCALMLAMAGMIWWAFGWRVLCVALLVYATNFPNRWYWNGGSLLRYDWLFWTVAGVCLTKKDKLFLGGAAIAYATLLRLFPGFLMLGPLAAAVQRLIKEGRVDRRYLSMFGGAALAIGVLVPVSIKTSGSAQSYVRFVENTKKHASTPLTNYMGLRTVIAWRPSEVGRHLRSDRLTDPWSEWKAARLKAFDRFKIPFYLLALAAMALLARAVQGREPWVALSLGAIMIAVGAELTCYYYSFLVAVSLLYEKRRDVGWVMLGIAFLTQFIAWAPLGMSTWTDEQYTAMSVATLIGVGMILYWFAFLPEPTPDDQIPIKGAKVGKPAAKVAARAAAKSEAKGEAKGEAETATPAAPVHSKKPRRRR